MVALQKLKTFFFLFFGDHPQQEDNPPRKFRSCYMPGVGLTLQNSSISRLFHLNNLLDNFTKLVW